MTVLRSVAKRTSAAASALGMGGTLWLLSASQAFAAFGGPTPALPSTATGDVRTSIVGILNFLLGFLALLAVVFVVVGGVRILVAGGNQEQVQAGKKTIIYAIVGLMIVFFARILIGFFTNEIGTAGTN